MDEGEDKRVKDVEDDALVDGIVVDEVDWSSTPPPRSNKGANRSRDGSRVGSFNTVEVNSVHANSKA